MGKEQKGEDVLTIKAANKKRTKDGSKLAAADYYISYAAATSTPPRWYGTTALEALGLERGGEADPEIFLALCERGEAPDGTVLHRPSSRGVPFYDLTLTLPKSLSLLSYCHPDEHVRQTIRELLEESAQRMVEWMETSEMFRSRRGHAAKDGVVRASTVACGFRHATNRNDQPHNHVHLLVANLCLGEDGRWRALDSASLFGSKQPGAIVKAASQVHDAIVRDLCRERGIFVDWTQLDTSGLREIRGIKRSVINYFSRDLGIPKGESFEARTVAQYRTRKKKSESLPDDLLPGWLADLEAQGVTQEKLRSLLHRSPRTWSPPDPKKILGRVTQERATFSRVELLGWLAASSPNGASWTQLEALADEILNSEVVIPVIVPDDTPGLAHDPTPARWTTQEALARENGMIELALACKKSGGPIVDTAVVETAITDASLDDEQAEAVRAIATTPGLVKVLEAEAGTGKTRSLAALTEACRREGIPTLGLAIAGRAVVELSEGANVGAITVESWWDGSPTAPQLPTNGIIIVDEASMMPTKQLSVLIRHAHERGSRVVLCGDRRQLGSVEAGGGFAALADRLGALRLTQNRRLASDKMLSASQSVRNARTAEAVATLQRVGAFTVAEDEDEAMGALINDWWRAREAGTKTAILAYHRADTQRLNLAAQSCMREHGWLGEASVTLAANPEQGLPERTIYIGDDVIALHKHTSKQARVVNGSRGVVVAIGDDKVVVREGESKLHVLPIKAYCNQWLNLGYSSTIHKSQGQTVGTAVVGRGEQTSETDKGMAFIYGGEQLSREAAYVALTRAVDASHIYSTRLALTDDEWDEGERDPLEIARRRWAKSEAQQLGIVEAERAERVVSLAATEQRSELEHRYSALSTLLQRGSVDLDAAVDEAQTALDEAKERGDDELAIARAEARLEALVKQRDTWRLAPPDLVTVRSEAEILSDALALQRRGVVLDKLTQRPDWLTKALGDVPSGPADIHLYTQAIGMLVDAEHWIHEARTASQSTAVQSLATPQVIHQELAAAVGSGDGRMLEELAPPEQIEVMKRTLVAPLPSAVAAKVCDAPMVERVAAALVASGGSVSDEDVSSALEGLPYDDEGGISVGLVASRLRKMAAEKLPNDAPVAAKLAVSPGVTTPTIRSVVEAIRIRQELDEREEKREKRHVWQEIAIDESVQNERDETATARQHERERQHATEMGRDLDVMQTPIVPTKNQHELEM